MVATGELSTLEALHEHFGFERFLPGQEEVIDHLLAGNSAAAVFPTGAGKSLCYQLPALLLPGLTLVVSPLIALMKDQLDALTARGIAAARLDSTLGEQQYRQVMDDLRGGRLRILYVAPERFANERFRESIAPIKVSLFAVDEAHCISEWGHNFRPDYLKLAGFAAMCGAERVLALTATATPKVLDDICNVFAVDKECAVRTGFYRPNLTLLHSPTSGADRDRLLEDRLSQRPRGSTIVYVTLQRTAEQVAERLVRAGYEAKAYHAGMDNERRATVQDWFLGSQEGIVVATIAFGMGIDKAAIRYIYHYNLPKSLENYSQEIGRAGRDHAPSTCEMFLCPDDLNVLENFIHGDTPSPSAVASLVAEMFAHDERFDVSYYDLSARHDIRLLVTRTLLTYLELDGYLEGGTPYYASYRFRPRATSSEILNRFDPVRRTFLADLFRQARKASTWFHLDVEAAADALACDRTRVVRALDYLGEKQLLDVEASGVRNRYRIVRKPADADALAKALFERTIQREARDLARLHQVIELAEHDGCQASHLGAHFGEPLDDPCSHCSWCANRHTPLALPERRCAEIDDGVWSTAVALAQRNPQVLSDPRVLARLLCGLTSPQLTKAKLTRNELFGVLQHVPFQQVLQRAEQSL